MMTDVNGIIAENSLRHKLINGIYDPVTGEGCQGDRVRFEIRDAPCPLLYLPAAMAATEPCQLLSRHGSIAALFEASGERLTAEAYTHFWIGFCELRIQYDFEFFAFQYETIEDGDTAEDRPFRLKRSQRTLLGILENMRLANVPIRVIILKARQMGLSTITQLYMLWIQCVHRKNWHSVICAHVKDSATNIRAMYDKVIENILPVGGSEFTLAPFKSTQNIKVVPERGCRITIGSAEKPESVRGQNPKLAHFSEVAFYPDTTRRGAAQLIGSVIGSMKRLPLTMIVYESTANGVGDYFHTQWEKAKKGETAFEPVFLAWYYDERYSEPLGETYYNHCGKRVGGDLATFVRSMSEHELALFASHPQCTLENLNWYRGKSSEMSGVELMKQEYPSDDIEAFQDSGLPAFRAEHAEALRGDCREPSAIGTLVADGLAAAAKTDPSRHKAILRNIRFAGDPEYLPDSGSGDPRSRERRMKDKLKIWEFPDSRPCTANRYVVVFDPQKGISEKADFGVIAVFDRYPMACGGKPEIVAEWRGQVDKDITIWIAAQVACYYNRALLVVESNTYDSEYRENDTEFIFDTLADHYSNLYSRTPAGNIKDGFPVRYGFNTNRSTKPMIIANYVAMLREKGYVERHAAAIDEARVYEQKPNGSFGAKEGRHDDILMTRMIGCYICYDLPLPQTGGKTPHSYPRRIPAGESSF